MAATPAIRPPEPPLSSPAGGDIILFRSDPDLNMDRFYAMSVQPDLFGGAQLVREWGRRGTRGRMMATHHPDEAAAIAALVAMFRKKSRRGYLFLEYQENFRQ